MWPYLLLGGVAIGAAVAAAIFNEETEEEKRKQQQLHNKYKDREREFQEREKAQARETAARRQEIREQARREEELARRRAREERRREIEKIVSEFRQLAVERLREKEKLAREIRETRQKCGEALKGQKSHLRKNALEGLARELEEAMFRVDGYCVYLKKYIHQLERHKGLNFPPEMPYKLPEGKLYRGKLIYLPKSELREHGQLDTGVGDGWSFPDRYRFTEFDYITDRDSGASIPLMCDYFLGDPDFEMVLSAKKGYFKHILANAPRTGLRAKVKKIRDKRTIELEFADATPFILRRDLLENPARLPPLGAALLVYPLNWDYLLKYPVKVSQRAGDSYLACSFDEIPMAFTEDEWARFEQVLLARGLEEATGEWKLAPLHESALPALDDMKIQLGGQLCFSAHVRDDKGRLYLKFGEVLEKDQFLKADDIFFMMECELIGFLEEDMGELPPEAFENMKSLYLRSLSEFKIQMQIQQSKKGLQYYNQWHMLTDRMIGIASKGERFKCPFRIARVREDESGFTYTLKLEPENPESLRKFISRCREGNNRATFFIEPERGRFIDINFEDDQNEAVIVSSARLGAWLENIEDVTIYCRKPAVPEARQARAIRKFRDGRLTNPVLQIYALDGSRIVSNRRDLPASTSFLNKRIAEDESQAKAVLNSLAEKEIYLIQGPPGTGKTTVIREVIGQELKNDPAKRILLVSQANVAVDNVLRNFREANIEFIRCGHDGAINPDLLEHSFYNMCQSYANSVRERLAMRPDDELLRYWHDNFITDDAMPLRGNEWYLRKFQLVGATCVGLANPSIGLERQTFDLVIVDEAGKALPGELLIPYNLARKVILLGDHRQLPPLLPPDLELPGLDRDDFDEDHIESPFACSMFQRMFEDCPASNKTMLATQYRMPASIGSMISEVFYDGKIKNGAQNCPPLLDWRQSRNIVFFDHDYPEETRQGQSPCNNQEARMAGAVLKMIGKRNLPPLDIAIITPYKGQKRLLRDMVSSLPSRHKIKVDTVDSFQGDEADIVFFCTTRTKRQTAFFSDARRINVALSRARNQLYVFGSLEYFKSYGPGHFLPRIAAYIEKNGEIISRKDLFPGC